MSKKVVIPLFIASLLLTTTANAGIKVKIRKPKWVPKVVVPLPPPPQLPRVIPKIPDVPLVLPKPLAAVTQLVDDTAGAIGHFAGDAVREAGIGAANVVRASGVPAVEAELRKVAGNAEKIVRRTHDDLGDAVKKVRGEVESAAVATYRYTVRTVENSKDVVSEAEQRFREGKVLDAMWHLAIDPQQRGLENMAQTSSESFAINAAASVAASTFGGPAGAAAYASYIAYYQSGGNTTIALRAGLVAVLQATASELAKAPPSAQATARVGEAVRRAAMVGTLNGIAVAANGGDLKDVQMSLLTSAGTLLISDGYQALADPELVAEVSQRSQQALAFAQRARQIYCVKSLVEGHRPEMCPRITDYLKDDKGRFAMLDHEGKLQHVDLTKEVPGSEWLFLSKEEALRKAAGEAALRMNLDGLKDIEAQYKTAVKALKSAKTGVVSLMETRFALTYTPAQMRADLQGGVAAAIGLTYVGLPQAAAPSAEAVKKLVEEAVPSAPQEIVSCTKSSVLNSVTGLDLIDPRIERIWMAQGKSGDTHHCAINRQVSSEVEVLWAAKNDASSCQPEFAKAVKAFQVKGYACAGR